MRGSTPCSCDSNRRYGGNTSCVAVEWPDRDPILLDLGTGLRIFGRTQPTDGTFRGTALVSHLHVYAPRQDEGSLCEAVRAFMSPPYFPVEIDALPGTFTFHEASDQVVDVHGAKVTAATVPHIGPTVGYRVEFDGVSVAYISDHQQPAVGSTEVAASVLDLCEGVDLLIHDAQFDDDEFAHRHDWGHCTSDYAIEVAARSGAKRLALFHHDPSHCDVRLDELAEQAAERGARLGLDEVITAAEGLTLLSAGDR